MTTARDAAAAAIEGITSGARRAPVVPPRNPRVVVARGLLALLVAATVLATIIDHADAAPRPDPAPPLAYTRAAIANAAYAWSEDVLATPGADGVAWQPWRASCSTRRRCRIDGVWWVDNTYTLATYRLRACRATRRVWENDAAHTRTGWVARVLVDRRGGVICKLPNPPYIPAEAAS